MMTPSLFGYLVLRSASSLVPGRAFWPYFAGTVVLLTGLAVVFKAQAKVDAAPARGIDKILASGPLFVAIPMAVFGADHFVAANIVAAMVPSWIPGHLFWTYFVGVALFAAALSLATNRYATLAATLLGTMIFLFVLLIHVPELKASPGDRIIHAVFLRDLSFSAGAFAFAIAHSRVLSSGRLTILMATVRLAIAIPTVYFGVEHFLHPHHVPVVPLAQLLPAWIPAHGFIAYFTGMALIVCGLSMIADWNARLAATWLGTIVFVIVLLVYLPMVLAAPSDIGNGLNYMVDTLAFSGSVLFLAGALANEQQWVREGDRVSALEQQRLEMLT
jgi:uncharacterized membrane protein